MQLGLPDWAIFLAQFGNPSGSALQLGLPDWAGNMAQSGNPRGELRCVCDIPTQKNEGSRGVVTESDD